MTDREAIAWTYIQEFAERIEELKAIANERDGFSDNYVLWLWGMALTFKVLPGGRCVDPRPCRLEDAYHLKQSEALRLAPHTFNGVGDHAQVLTFADACAESIRLNDAAIDSVLKLIRG